MILALLYLPVAYRLVIHDAACSRLVLAYFFSRARLFVLLSCALSVLYYMALRGTLCAWDTAGSANVPIVGIKRVGREGNTVSVSAAGRGTIGFEPQVLL